MTDILVAWTIVVLFQIIIILYQVTLIVRINRESEVMKKENAAFKKMIEQMYSQNISDVIIENQKTIKAINNLINK